MVPEPGQTGSSFFLCVNHLPLYCGVSVMLALTDFVPLMQDPFNIGCVPWAPGTSQIRSWRKNPRSFGKMIRFKASICQAVIGPRNTIRPPIHFSLLMLVIAVAFHARP